MPHIIIIINAVCLVVNVSIYVCFVLCLHVHVPVDENLNIAMSQKVKFPNELLSKVFPMVIYI